MKFKITFLPFLTKFFACTFVFIGFYAMLFARQGISTAKDTTIYTGTASFYHKKFEGRRTASGEIFSNNKMTAASNVIPLGATVKVTNRKNKKTVKVKINDRMSRRSKRLIDLSRKAAKKLKMIHRGLTKVKVKVIPEEEK